MARSRRNRTGISGPILWVGLCVGIAGIVVQTTRNGIDILALLVSCFVLLLVERTVGDWVAESVGPAPTALIFATVAAAGVMYVTSDSGRGRASRLFIAAEARGYRTAYFEPVSRKGGAGDISRVPAPAALNLPGQTPRAALSPPAAVALKRAAPSERLAGSPGATSVAGGVRLVRLSVAPDLSVVGQPVILRAELSSDSGGVLPSVEFTIDGRNIASVVPNASGVAEAPWRTNIPGQYIVRARVPRGLLGVSASSATLTVLPRSQ
jgi:hypothetical protein